MTFRNLILILNTTLDHIHYYLISARMIEEELEEPLLGSVTDGDQRIHNGMVASIYLLPTLQSLLSSFQFLPFGDDGLILSCQLLEVSTAQMVGKKNIDGLRQIDLWSGNWIFIY